MSNIRWTAVLIGVLLLASLAPLAAAQTPVPTPTPRPCAAPLELTIGGDAILIGGVNVRNLPTQSGGVVNYYSQETRLRITGGPVCAEGYNWWQVAGVGEPGWVAEGRDGRYFLSPAAPDPSTVCPPAIPTVGIGSQVRIEAGLRAREEAGRNARVLTTVRPGMVLDVLDGPVCADGMNWWQVRAPYGLAAGVTVDAWISEGYPRAYWFAPEGLAQLPVVATCARALPLSPGDRAAVTYDDGVPRRLRSAPGVQSDVIATLLDGIAFEIISGPACMDSFHWWEVRILTTGLTGWLAEGVPGNYWFEVIAY